MVLILVVKLSCACWRIHFRHVVAGTVSCERLYMYCTQVSVLKSGTNVPCRSHHRFAALLLVLLLLMSTDSPNTQQLNAIRSLHARLGPNEHVKVVAARLREEYKVR